MSYLKYLLILLAGVLLLVTNYLNTTVCDRPLKYSFGLIDNRFNITEDEFKNLVFKAEQTWESAIERELFVYDDQAPFRISLIYDERQQRTDEAKLNREQIDETAKTYDQLVEEYDRLYPEYQRRLQAYEEEVHYWNDRGGAPKAEYEKLEKERQYLLSQVQKLNSIQDRINRIAQRYNLNIESYNERFSVAQPFDQGTYNGEEITIYQFDNKADLELVLAHEFGHALNLDHNDDPKAVMYYLLGEQDTNPVKITASDLGILKAECRLE